MSRRFQAAPSLPPWLDNQLPFDRFSVQVTPDLEMHVMERAASPATDAPTVLMVHGNPTWGYLYRKIAQELGEQYHLVMPDLIGLGLSSKPRDPTAHTLAKHATWLASCIDSLGLERVVVVVQDWGGPIGTLGAATSKAEVVGMVVMNTVLAPPKPGFKSTAFHRFSRLPVVSELAYLGLGFPQIALHTAQGDKSSIRGEVAKAYRWPLRYPQDRVAPLALARMVPDSLHHPSVAELTRCEAVISAFDGPAEIVWGNKDPVLGRLRNRIARALPQAKVTDTDGGHFLQEEHPKEIAEAIHRVLNACS